MAAVVKLTSVFNFASDGRGWQGCQEEAREPEPGSGPGHRPLLPIRHVRPPGNVQAEDQDHWDQGEGSYMDALLNKNGPMSSVMVLFWSSFALVTGGEEA